MLNVTTSVIFLLEYVALVLIVLIQDYLKNKDLEKEKLLEND